MNQNESTRRSHIEKGKKLLSVPWKSICSSGGDGKRSDGINSNSGGNNGNNICGSSSRSSGSNNNNEVVVCSLLVLDSLHYRWSRAPRGVGSPDWRRR